MYSGVLKDYLSRLKVKDKEKLNNPTKGWQILSTISSMVFHTVQWANSLLIIQNHNKNTNIYPFLDLPAKKWPFSHFFQN